MELITDVLAVLLLYLCTGVAVLALGVIKYEFLPTTKLSISVVTLWPIYIVFLVFFKLIGVPKILGDEYTTDLVEYPVYNVLNGEEVKIEEKFFDHKGRFLICMKKHLHNCHTDHGRRCVYYLNDCDHTKCMAGECEDRQGRVFVKTN